MFTAFLKCDSVQGVPEKACTSAERDLRTVPTIVIAHTFCASRDTRISYRWRLLIQGYFCAAQNYAEKADVSKCSWQVLLVSTKKIGGDNAFFRDN